MAKQITSEAVTRWRIETEFLPKRVRRHPVVARDEEDREQGDGHGSYPGCNRSRNSQGTWQENGRLNDYRSGFGFVERERCEDGPAKGSLRVVKEVKKKDWPTDADAKRELDALAVFSDALNSEYKDSFVQYFGWFTNLSSIYLAMEYMPLGNLEQRVGASGCSEKETATITYQILRALKSMHEKGFVHRNLKPRNILVARPGPNWHVKLADFGICRQLKLVAFARRHEGTVSYVAPEYTYVNYHLGDRPYLPGNQPEYSPAMDVWALGGVVYMVRAGHPPFNSDEEVDAYMEDSAPNFPTDPLRAVSEGCVKFIRRAMAGDEDARPTVAELLEDSWLGSFEGLDGSIRDG